MHLPFRLFLPLGLLLGLMLSCVDPEALTRRSTIDVVVVDGTITNLNEPQTIRLNRSKADRLTGRPGLLPLTKAVVEVLVDSVTVVAAWEISDGTYQLPDDFRGRIGHAYRLRFTLSDGTRYESSDETMPAEVPIERVTDQYNPQGLPPDNRPLGLLASNDLYVQTTDPADQRNYYRWDWVLWEHQNWCQTCVNGYYYQYDDSGKLIDKCVPT